MNYFMYLFIVDLSLSVCVKDLSECLTSLGHTGIVRTQIKIFFQCTQINKLIISRKLKGHNTLLQETMICSLLIAYIPYFKATDMLN